MFNIFEKNTFVYCQVRLQGTRLWEASGYNELILIPQF